jgi:hypothetical protein
MDEPRIRTATSAHASAIVDIVDQAYRHYTARIGKPPGPMLDDYVARVAEGVVWVLEEGAAVIAIMLLLSAPDYLLLDNIAVSLARQRLGLGRRLLAFAEGGALAPAIVGWIATSHSIATALPLLALSFLLIIPMFLFVARETTRRELADFVGQRT